MAEARDRAAWNRTLAVLAQMYNANRGKNDQPEDPMQFFPWHEGTKRKVTPPPSKADLAMLKHTFPGKKG